MKISYLEIIDLLFKAKRVFKNHDWILLRNLILALFV